MSPDLSFWKDLALLSLRDPRAGGAAVLRLGLPAATGWLALALASVLSAFLTHVLVLLRPAVGTGTGAFPVGPLALAGMQFAFLALTVAVIFRVGRTLGGQGGAEGAVIIVAWSQILLTAVQVAQAVLFLVLPPLAEMVGLLGLILMFWLLTGFICALHGFTSQGAVFAGIMAVSVVVVLVLATGLVLLGLPEMMVEG